MVKFVQIPDHYMKKALPLMDEITKSVDKLWPYVSEMADKGLIIGENWIITIEKRSKK